ncbi:MAG: MaoC family dehydratase [Solirubrobacterales bacterium]|nr:MaoC family dehydratase [Solirubrobacterales bacterium]
MTTTDLVFDMASLRGTAGRHLGHTEWAVMTQEQVDEFANLTGDHNFLHVDPERARDTPFGGTIAHGFLSLSLLAPVTQRLQVSDAATSVNYGLDKVRFPAPLPVGARWRGSAEITEVSEIKGGLQAKMAATLEVEGSERPAVVAESLIRYYA